MMYSTTNYFSYRIYFLVECQNFAAAWSQKPIRKFFALPLKKVLPSHQAYQMSSAYVWLKAGWRKITACQSRSSDFPNPEVIILEKSKEDIFVLLLPDSEEDFNLLENEKKVFGQAFGIAP